MTLDLAGSLDRRVTQKQAERVLAAVHTRFRPYVEEGYGPKLIMEFDFSGAPRPAIVWEDGPFEWAHLASSGGVDEGMASLARNAGIRTAPPEQDPVKVAGLFLEPITSWALGIYPG